MNRFPRTARSKAATAGLTAAVIAASLTVSMVAGAESSDAARRSLAIGPGLAISREAKVMPGTARVTPKPVTVKPAAPKPVTSKPVTPKPAAPVAAPARATGGPFLGTLVTHSDTAARESQAGLKMAMLEFNWRSFEPQRGQFSSTYAAWMLKQLRAFQAAGMQVTLGLGLHFAPTWALDLAGSRMVNQDGRSSATLDLVFNQTLRDLAATYVAKVDQAVGLENFWAVRITSGGLSELMYPSGGYFAYSAGAQNGPSKPASIAPNPMPGWKPSQSATPQQRDAWARWYLAALDDVADWQMTLAGQLGFTGYFQILTPGQGLRPTQYNRLVAGGLTDGLLARGAVWHLIYEKLPRHPHITAYVSSVADGSANDDVCQSSDSSVALTSGTAYYFSATRYLSRIAAVNGFTVAGETPGFPPAGAARSKYQDASTSGLISKAMAQARGCGLLGLYWAHDDQVWNGSVSLSMLARHTTTSAVAPARAR